MNADWIRGIRVKRVDGIKNIDDIKQDIKEAVDIMKKENKVSKEYNDLVKEICNSNLVQMTTTMEETEMLNDYERDYLEEKLDNLNRIKSEYDKYEWLLDVDPDYDLDAKTQIDISRLRGILHNCLKNCELLKGIGDDVEREIIESAYNIIKRHCDETGKKLKTFLYIMGDNDND